ncbi:MAG: AAA family ATPase [Deltaproteobacteria bacterium]|nr:AAA family ATPase [Deltaproteobacteria bacterium]
MIVSHIKLKNWRNFRNAEADLGRRMFLVGPNASGKSNFLDAFRFLRDIARPGGGLQKAVEDRNGISKIRCLAARKEPQVGIDVTLSSVPDGKVLWRYSIALKQESRGSRNPYLEHEKIWKDGKLILDRPDSKDREDSRRLTQTHLEQISANYEFREIAEFFESISYLHMVPQLLRHQNAFSGPDIRDDPFGRNFIERLARTTEGTRNTRLRKIEKALRLVVPQLKALSMTIDDAGKPHLEVTEEHWRLMCPRLQEEEFSDGTLRLIGFLWSLLEGDSLLLLEEPELYLHTAIIRRLPGIIWRIQTKKKRQTLISTHSYDLLLDNGIGGEEVLVLIPDSEGTKIRTAASLSDVRALLESGISVAEATLPRTEPRDINQLSLFND